MLTIRPRMAAIGLVLTVALAAPALAGCSGAVQGAVEQAAEDAIGGNVDISSDGLSVTDSNGNEIQIGADVAMPDNWPAELPQVEGGKLVSVMVAGDGASVNAMWTVAASPADASKAYGDALTSAGFTQDQITSAGDMESTQWTGNGYRVNVIASGSGGETSVLVNAEKS